MADVSGGSPQLNMYRYILEADALGGGLVVLQSAVTGEEYLRLPISELGTGQQIKRILARFLGHPTFAIVSSLTAQKSLQNLRGAH